MYYIISITGYITALIAIGGALFVGLAALACYLFIIRKFMKPSMSVRLVPFSSFDNPTYYSTQCFCLKKLVTVLCNIRVLRKC